MEKQTNSQIYQVTEGDFAGENRMYRGYGIAYCLCDGGNRQEGAIENISTERGEVETLLARIDGEPLIPEVLQEVVEDYLGELAAVFLA